MGEHCIYTYSQGEAQESMLGWVLWHEAQVSVNIYEFLWKYAFYRGKGGFTGWTIHTGKVKTAPPPIPALWQSSKPWRKKNETFSYFCLQPQHLESRNEKMGSLSPAWDKRAGVRPAWMKLYIRIWSKEIKYSLEAPNCWHQIRQWDSHRSTSYIRFPPWWITDEGWHRWGVTNIRDSQTVIAIQAWGTEHQNPEKQEWKEAPETMSLCEL